jgi:ABC-type uncharacterized transport system substrate-binding protein
VTSTVRIVFANVSDPIGSGFVQSLARRSGNTTGLLLFEETITGEWLALLKELVPGLARAAFIANPKTTPYDCFLGVAGSVAHSLGVELVPTRIETADDIARAVESLASTPNGGLVLPPDVTINVPVIGFLNARTVAGYALSRL